MKNILGKVVSTKMDKTVIVAVVRYSQHPLYKKMIRRTKRYKVHREGENIQEGDTVKIEATRPVSKGKHYKIVKVINK